MLLPETLQQHDHEKYEFHYLYFLPWKNQLVSAIEAAGGRVTCLPASNNLQLLLKSRQIAKYCRTHQIDLIHAHLPWAGIAARIGGKLARIPVVYTEHNNFHRYNLITQWASRLTYAWQQKVITVSEEAKDVIDRLNLHPDVEYVANGVDTEKFQRHASSTSDGTLTVGTVAVFRKQKRLDRFLEIAAQCQKESLPIHFLLAGDGPERSSLESQARGAQLTGVEFLGLLPDPRPAMERMDAFLITSDFEGLPVALLEAMSMEVVPVSSAVGGIPSVVEDRKNGLLIDPTDTQAIIQWLKEMLAMPVEERLELARNSRRTVIERFSIRRMVRQLEQIYDNILDSESVN